MVYAKIKIRDNARGGFNISDIVIANASRPTDQVWFYIAKNNNDICQIIWPDFEIIEVLVFENNSSS